MVKITEVPTLSIVLNLLYRMQQKFRRSTVKKGRITLERNWLIQGDTTFFDVGSPKFLLHTIEQVQNYRKSWYLERVGDH